MGRTAPDPHPDPEPDPQPEAAQGLRQFLSDLSAGVIGP